MALYARLASGDVPMSGARLKLQIVLVGLLCGLSWLPIYGDGKPHGKKQVQQAPAPPPPPPVPLTPEQSPAEPPTVQYLSGQLTITAPNSTLGDILRAVRRQTGASVEVPGNATERVVGTFGPGPARDVMSSLLNGSHFNYLLLGSASDPNALDRVILTSRSGGPAGQTAAAVPQGQAGAMPQPQPAEEQDGAADDSAEVQPDAADTTADDQGQAQDDQQPQQPQPGNPFGAQGVKSPEQLLQELQQRQQQVQQQQGAPTPPQGFPQPPQQRQPE